MHAAGRDTSTDADAIHIAREGVATALVSIPNRYMHSPNEMVSLDDLDRAAELIAETCRAVTRGDGLHRALAAPERRRSDAHSGNPALGSAVRVLAAV